MSKTLLQAALIAGFGLSSLAASAQVPWVVETSLPAYCPMRCTLINQTKQMQMYAAGVGWVQNETVLGMGAGSSISAFYTTDDGRSWQSIGTLLTPTASVRSLWILPDLTAFGIAQTVTGTTEVVKKTMQGSSTWAPSFNVAGAVPLVVRFFDNNEGLILTTTFAVYRTTDQGATWTAASGPLAGSAGNTFGSIELLGNDVWLTTTQGQLWHSSNRGATWGPAVNVGLTTNGLVRVSFSDAQNGLAYVPGGQATQLRRTVDGGATWATVNATGPRRLRILTAVPGEAGTYLSAGVAGAAGDQAGLALSTDSGENWRTIESNYSYLFLQAYSRTQVWAVSYAPEYSAFLRSPGNILAARAGNTRPLTLAYPNPTTGRLHVSGPPGATVRVFDVTGRLQHTGQVAADAEVDLSGLAPGRYQVQLTDKQGGRWSQAVSVVR